MSGTLARLGLLGRVRARCNGGRPSTACAN